MTDFKKILAERKANAANSLAAKASEANKSNTFEKKEDTRFWQPEVDKVGNGYAVIRFLDAPAGEDMPWVRVWSHGFKGPNGRWYIENSLTTIGKPDPVAELNSKLWATGTEANKEIVRKQKRKLTYISNILVVSDPKHPENDGQVKLFRYGKKIYDKIKDVMSPPEEFQDEVPMDPFNFWAGANFKLKIRNVEGYRNYDKSEFEKPSEIGDDDFIEELMSKLHPLQQFVAPDQFESYDVLKDRLAKVLDVAPTGKKDTAETSSSSDDDQIDYEELAKASKPEPEKAKAAGKKPIAKKETVTAEGEEDDDISYFTKIANGKEDDDAPF